jgi:hypothetical protein
LPKNPGAEWAEELRKDPQFKEDCLYRLGNMCLLTKVNRDLGRKGFTDKKVEYARSEIRVTRSIAEFEGWGRDEVDRRQKFMSELALQAWKFQ